MRLVPAALALSALVLAAGCGDRTDTARAAYPTCLNGAVQVTRLEPGGQETGEHGLVVDLINRGDAPCTLRGYPVARILDRNDKPLAFRQQNGGQYVTTRRPADVDLRAGDGAVVQVEKYRCDIQPYVAGRWLLLTLPGMTDPLRLRLPPQGIEGMSWCSERPSQALYVSPVVQNDRELSLGGGYGPSR